MHLTVQPVVPTDFDTAKHLYGPETGDVVAPLCAAIWHVDPTDTATAKHRAEWSCQQQKELLEGAPTAHVVKVVDTDAKPGEEIVAIARWHEYKRGNEHIGDLELIGRKDRDDPATWPEGLDRDFYLGFCDEAYSARRAWMGEGHYWGMSTSNTPFLTTIVTREPLRKHGAGSMLLDWGLEQAKKAGVPAYLEAVPQAMGLYAKHGFRDVGRHVTDCTPFGLPGVSFEVARMRADP
ncbi:hypothetical protein LTR85_012178 [Meristemomyces frigidus]|nr:hypothetical protein LTR85_012178 [Meristemomyces frigidus]